MGISIYLSGRLKKPELWEALSTEVEDICKTNAWKYRLVGLAENAALDNILSQSETDDDGMEMITGLMQAGMLLSDGKAKLQGIVFKIHDDCEPLELLFDEKGILASFMTLLMERRSRKYPTVFCRTQKAGADLHVKLIHLLMYLQKKYFKKLHIVDAGGYYPDQDLETLQERMGTIENAIASINDFMEHADLQDKTPDEMIAEMQKMFAQTFGDMLNVRILKIDINERTISDATTNDDEENTPKPKKKRSPRKKKDDDDQSA